jgi:hypothetical protein
MRVYLELIEVLPPYSTATPDFIRIDVTNWSQDDINTAIQQLMQQAQVYQSYILRVHYCRHDEGKPCAFTLLSSK